MNEWSPGTNIATKKASELLRPYALKRNEEAVEKSSGSEYAHCQKCVGNGNKNLYLKKDMKKVPYIKKSGKKYNVWYCVECFRTYKPHSRRAGGKNE